MLIQFTFYNMNSISINIKLHMKMKINELEEAVYLKNLIISNQLKRITLLEEKFAELRRRFFRLKYKDYLTIESK